jgi:hypothetical protein
MPQLWALREEKGAGSNITIADCRFAIADFLFRIPHSEIQNKK